MDKKEKIKKIARLWLDIAAISGEPWAVKSILKEEEEGFSEENTKIEWDIKIMKGKEEENASDNKEKP